MPLLRLLSPSLPALIAITLCACGSGSDSSSDNAQTSDVPTQSSIISGSVVKGVVQNALVSAYAISDGQVNQLLTSTTTNNLGQYSLNITQYDGPVYLEVTPNNAGTSMICDSASDCGDYIGISDYDINQNGVIDFGEQFTVPSDFILTAALADSSDINNASITTLTHLAAQLAASYPQGINDVSIEVAHSIVEDLFQVSALSNTATVDLSNTSAVQAATENELRHALLSSALLGLTNDVAFAQVLNSLTQQFQTNNGQLVTQDNAASIPTLLDLTSEALSTAELLGLDQLITELTQEQSTLMSADSGSLTSATPSPTAGGDSAAIITAFLDDLYTWQAYLSLSPDQTSFSHIVSAIGVSTGSDLAQMLQAVSIAGQFGPVVALPDAALDAACDSLGNYLAKLSCRLLISGKSLEEICNGTLNLVIFNRSLCDILNELTLPLGNGLTGDFALYDGTARIYGRSQNIDVDITFTALDTIRSTYGFSISGTAESDIGMLEIVDGRFELVFDGGLDIRNLKLPETAAGSISVNYQQFSTAQNISPTSFSGDLSIELNLSGVTQSSDDTQPYSGLDSIGLSMLADGVFESDYGDRFEGSIALNGGLDSDIVVQFETDLPDYSDRAVITLSSTPSQLAQGQINDIEIAWGGKSYDIMYFFSPYRGVRITNQDGVIMDLDLEVNDNDAAGYLFLNGTSYGRVSPLNGSLLFTLSNGVEVVM